MATEVETGHGSEFHLADAQGELRLLGELTDIPIPSGAAGLIDASHMQSVGFKDYITEPLQDGEEVDLVMNWIPGSETDQLAREAKGHTRAFKTVLKVGGATRDITGFVLVRDYVRSNPMLGKRTGTLRVKWVGEPNEAEGAAGQ